MSVRSIGQLVLTFYAFKISVVNISLQDSIEKIWLRNFFSLWKMDVFVSDGKNEENVNGC